MIKSDKTINELVEEGWKHNGHHFSDLKIYQKGELRLLYDKKYERVVAYYDVNDVVAKHIYHEK